MPVLSRFASILAATTIGLAACTTTPKTAEDAYRQTKVRAMSRGRTLVVGPVLNFMVGNRFGYAAFQAVVQAPQPTYFLQSTLASARLRPTESVNFPMTPEKMADSRAKGARLTIVEREVEVYFPAFYFEGFLRRVGEVPVPAAASPAPRN